MPEQTNAVLVAPPPSLGEEASETAASWFVVASCVEASDTPASDVTTVQMPPPVPGAIEVSQKPLAPQSAFVQQYWAHVPFSPEPKRQVRPGPQNVAWLSQLPQSGTSLPGPAKQA
jgi:hypothetical protein